MRCTGCGHDNPPESRFCNGCGGPLAAGCTSCGGENPPSARFCNQCGASLAIGAPSEREVPERSPRDYTPSHLAERILRSKSAIEGEHKQVTVLFADVKGSMALAEIARAQLGRGDHVERTGGKVLAPQILEERGRLAALLGDDALASRRLEAAREGYLAVGAHARADRLGEER